MIWCKNKKRPSKGSIKSCLLHFINLHSFSKKNLFVSISVSWFPRS